MVLWRVPWELGGCQGCVPELQRSQALQTFRCSAVRAEQSPRDESSIHQLSLINAVQFLISDVAGPHISKETKPSLPRTEHDQSQCPSIDTCLGLV